WSVEASVALVSPIRRAVGDGVVDVSHLGKLEVRGPVEHVEAGPGEELLRLAPARGLLVTGDSPAGALERLHAAGVRAYDLTAALAAFEFDGEDALRRLTDLDPAGLPAVGSVARGVRAIVDARGNGRFRLYVPQELGHDV